MDVYDLRMKYIPEFIGKGMKGVPSVADALGAKAVDYLQFAPAPDLNTAYNWLKESVMLKRVVPKVRCCTISWILPCRR